MLSSNLINNTHHHTPSGRKWRSYHESRAEMQQLVMRMAITERHAHSTVG